jgi:chromosome segregation protein
MIYIKKLIVKNFKSFGGLVKLNLEPGFNVVTGPNGSGKSNIIDAVQFVLGELGSRRMRVSDLSGLIFDGTDEGGSSKAVASQVTIYFDNSDRGFAIDRSVVSISRRIDRQGNSKYFLNGRRTSRRVVLDLLEMAGISPGGYNIVLQGTATRLSDLTASERMTALEDLIGITEYDEKKASAKVQLTEAERKIEVASARIDEVKKHVTELESQRNDALRHRLLSEDERKLSALKLSHHIALLESDISKIDGQMMESKGELVKLDGERVNLIAERDAARTRWEEFNKEATEKGSTRLPLLRSDLVAREAVKTSLESRLREIDSRKHAIQRLTEEKTTEIGRAKAEIEEKRAKTLELAEDKAEIEAEIAEREAQLQRLSDTISSSRESAETNQKRIESLTESLVPLQESLGGLEIEINRKLVSSNNIKEKMADLEQKRAEFVDGVDSLRAKLREYEELKASEAKKLEDMLAAMEEQIERQRRLRSTIESAGKLAKDAETEITQFSAKRDLWQKIVTEEKAGQRIREMGEAGALQGYHGSVRSFLKVDLKYQRAVSTSSNGWIRAYVFDDIDTVLECVERLKKTKLGTTKFLPLRNIRHLESPTEIEGEGILGPIPDLIRYEDRYAPVVKLIWGDTLLVQNRSAALHVAQRGYRAVTLSGDVYEAEGGVVGGFYRKPPDFSKLIPSEESVKGLSATIRTLREQLHRRMSDLKLSGGGLRKFTGFLDESSKSVERIEGEIRAIGESIGQLEKKIGIVDDKINAYGAELAQEQGLMTTLQERRVRTAQEIERTKAEIAELKELKPSDVTGLELSLNDGRREVVAFQSRRSQLTSDLSILTNLVDGVLGLKVVDNEGQIHRWTEELATLDDERSEALRSLEEASSDISELQKALAEITSDVESTGQVMSKHQSTMRLIEQRIEQVERRRGAQSQRDVELSISQEKLRLQREQRLTELSALGFEAKLDTSDADVDGIDRALQSIRAEKSSLGAINQLAEFQYAEIVGNYKQMSVRINELEEEKGSIIRFIDEVEKEKQEHFMKAYHQVCENFSSIFTKLTGGGDGRLELQKPEDPFTGGVDLYIQFPGKPMRLASGASGGERSVAAIAYLLAIQRFLKAPFYLFDEIDAHLDDLNESRLAEVLRENARESQFIVVTLKDVMVHNAERIYGIFSQGGRSKVLALPMKLEVAA